mmetsp:Transcript_44497/g.134895  ORF Transcript_44497/g.134895 Transcript_44497/m.134895 type:complete len:249 (-) Transcript_44497:299-1045(-)
MVHDPRKRKGQGQDDCEGHEEERDGITWQHVPRGETEEVEEHWPMQAIHPECELRQPSQARPPQHAGEDAGVCGMCFRGESSEKNTRPRRAIHQPPEHLDERLWQARRQGPRQAGEQQKTVPFRRPEQRQEHAAAADPSAAAPCAAEDLGSSRARQVFVRADITACEQRADEERRRSGVRRRVDARNAAERVGAGRVATRLRGASARSLLETRHAPMRHQLSRERFAGGKQIAARVIDARETVASWVP